MRITGGWAKGMRLTVPRGERTRPTTDRVREALFSSLGRRVSGAEVLDLYAGSGSLGLEAAGRGARSVVFVERDPRVLRILRANVEELVRRGFSREGIEIMRAEVRDALRRLERAGRCFDLIFADPPYASGEAAGVVESVAARGLLGRGGRLVVEHGAGGAPETVAGLDVVRHHRYGSTELTIYRPAETVPVPGEGARVSRSDRAGPVPGTGQET